MNIHTLHNLQEAYLDVYYDLDENISREVAARAATLSRQRKGQTPERKAMYQNLSRLASNRSGDFLASRLPLSRDEMVGMGWDITPASSQRSSESQTLGGISYHRGPKRVPSKLEKEKRQVQRGVRVAGNARRRQLGLPELSPTQMRRRLGLEDSYDYETYETIFSHLLDEGYADCLGSAEIILENMSDNWLDQIVEEFVDPETGKAPSGRSPVENVSYHPKKSVRRRAMIAFARQMEKEYGGKWRAKTKDPTKD